MHCRVPAVTARMRTFAPLAAVSFDGGTTWHRARVSGHGGRYAAVFTAPAAALVTLRTSAAGAAAGSVTETVTDGYRVAR